MKKILVLGAFGFDTNHLDGQTVKTRNIYKLLQQNYDDNNVDYVDTMHIRRKPLSLFKSVWKLIRCNKLILIPCLNNLTYIFPVTYYLSKLFRYDIIHICVGGWQLEYFLGNERFKSHPFQLRLSRKIKAFLPEMRKVEIDLTNLLGFSNTTVFPNFRFIKSDTKPIFTSSKTLRLVFLARVDKNKGYDTIFSFAREIQENGYDISIDFYGPITPSDKDEFLNLVDRYKSVVTYNGILQQDQVTMTLVNYDLMLLPTKYYTEGFPGSVLDAYIAGIPVVATNWKHAHEFIDDKKTGFVVSFNNSQKEFNESILTLYRDRNMLQKMKTESFKKRLQFSENSAWSVLLKYL